MHAYHTGSLVQAQGIYIYTKWKANIIKATCMYEVVQSVPPAVLVCTFVYTQLQCKAVTTFPDSQDDKGSHHHQESQETEEDVDIIKFLSCQDISLKARHWKLLMVLEVTNNNIWGFHPIWKINICALQLHLPDLVVQGEEEGIFFLQNHTVTFKSHYQSVTLLKLHRLYFSLRDNKPALWFIDMMI